MESINPIVKGSIVKYLNSNYRVTSVKAGKVNLGSIFGKAIYHKGIAMQDIVENAEGFYQWYSQSETYMCI